MLLTVFGFLDAQSNTCLTRAIQEWAHSLNILNKQLTKTSFLVGNSITLADLALASTLVNPVKFVLDESSRKAFASIIRWFNTVSA